VKKTTLILTSILLVFLVSCNVTQEYTFNKDLSGTSNLEIDISAMIGMLANLDSTKNNNSLDTLGKSLSVLAEEYKKLGATNVKFGDKNNKTIIYLSYDFKDIEMLNKLLSSKGNDMLGANFMGDSTTSKAKFINKGKRKLIYDAPQISNDTLFNNKDMASMKDYYNYTLKFNFATKIKSIKSKNAVLSSDKKTVKFSGSMFDIFASGYSTSFKIKLKRK